jgi:hypothetical protein
MIYSDYKSRVYSIIIICLFHILFGILSFLFGILTSIKAHIWVAHAVSPIWSGAFVSIHILPFFLLVLDFYYYFVDKSLLFVVSLASTWPNNGQSIR